MYIKWNQTLRLSLIFDLITNNSIENKTFKIQQNYGINIQKGKKKAGKHQFIHIITIM